MSLLEVVRRTPIGQNFTVATAFMQNEQATTCRLTTNRAESEHSVLKLCLSIYHGDLDTVFLNIYSLIEGQIADIKSLLEYFRLKEKFNVKNNPILKNVSNNIRHLALKKIWVWIIRVPKSQRAPRGRGRGTWWRMVIVDIELWRTLCLGMSINGLGSIDECKYHYNDRVKGWSEPYSDRITDWNTRYARARPPGNPIHVNL
ncbi:hypothetical protein M9H77_31639 [Catharanthus roseus]|uniref:Uncharacterized protein n=1 Tax=Catharanthus roseus TaxID=4058 RepID=A0ACC0A3C5_CATRO|nr:hypothetical protein M9H77_31639 [Catharanthus roseus]